MNFEEEKLNLVEAGLMETVRICAQCCKFGRGYVDTRDHQFYCGICWAFYYMSLLGQNTGPSEQIVAKVPAYNMEVTETMANYPTEMVQLLKKMDKERLSHDEKRKI